MLIQNKLWFMKPPKGSLMEDIKIGNHKTNLKDFQFFSLNIFSSYFESKLSVKNQLPMCHGSGEEFVGKNDQWTNKVTY